MNVLSGDVSEYLYTNTSIKTTTMSSIETLDTFIKTCQQTQHYKNTLKKHTKQLKQELNIRERQLHRSIQHCNHDQTLTNMSNAINALKEKQKHILDEVNNLCAFRAPLSVFIAIRDIIHTQNKGTTST